MQPSLLPPARWVQIDNKWRGPAPGAKPAACPRFPRHCMLCHAIYISLCLGCVASFVSATAACALFVFEGRRAYTPNTVAFCRTGSGCVASVVSAHRSFRACFCLAVVIERERERKRERGSKGVEERKRERYNS